MGGGGGDGAVLYWDLLNSARLWSLLLNNWVSFKLMCYSSSRRLRWVGLVDRTGERGMNKSFEGKI